MDCTTEKELIQLLKITILNIQKTIKKNKELYPDDSEKDLPEMAMMRTALKGYKAYLKIYE